MCMNIGGCDSTDGLMRVEVKWKIKMLTVNCGEFQLDLVVK